MMNNGQHRERSAASGHQAVCNTNRWGQDFHQRGDTSPLNFSDFENLITINVILKHIRGLFPV
jgi:hypothetical protein